MQAILGYSHGQDRRVLLSFFLLRELEEKSLRSRHFPQLNSMFRMTFSIATSTRCVMGEFLRLKSPSPMVVCLLVIFSTLNQGHKCLRGVGHRTKENLRPHIGFESIASSLTHLTLIKRNIGWDRWKTKTLVKGRGDVLHNSEWK